MKKVNHCMLRAVQVSACLLLGWAGCAGSTSNQSAAAPMQSTTAAEVTGSAANPGTSSGPADMGPTSPVANNAATPETTPPPEAPLTDGQIALIISDIDQAEIDAGKLAQSRAASNPVKQFGHHMVAAHSAVEARLNSVEKAQSLVPTDSPLSMKLKEQNHAMGQSLMGQSGADFDRSYLAAQVQGHQDVLDLLDNKIIPQVENPKLKADLQSFRTEVVRHIQMAKDAQAALPRQ